MILDIAMAHFESYNALTLNEVTDIFCDLFSSYPVSSQIDVSEAAAIFNSICDISKALRREVAVNHG